MKSRKSFEPWYYRYLRRHIAKIWGWSPERRKALKRAQIGRDMWKCEECGKEPLERKEREVDHIVPRENVAGWDGWERYIDRALEVKAEGLKILCKDCHYKKSGSENAERRKNKKARNI